MHRAFALVVWRVLCFVYNNVEMMRTHIPFKSRKKTIKTIRNMNQFVVSSGARAGESS